MISSTATGVLPNELLLASLEAAAEGVVITDANENILWVNRAFTRLTGYCAEEAIGQTPRIMHSGYHGAAFYAEMWETLDAGLNWQGIVVNRRKDGSLYREELSITPLRGERGKTTHYIAIKRNVTEREELAAKLKESERQYRRLFEASPIGLYETDPDGVILRVNGAACRLLGYMKEDVVGRALWDFDELAERNRMRDSTLAYLRGGGFPRRVERTYVSRRGRRIVVEEYQSLEFGPDGRVAGLSSAMIDITKRSEAEAALAESNHRYESLFRNSGDAIVVVAARAEGLVVEDVNPAFEKGTGRQRAEVLDKTFHQLLPAADADVLVRRYQACLDQGEPLNFDDVRELPAGTVQAQVRLNPIPNAAGKFTRVAGVVRDLTDRFRMEAELRLKEEQLRLVLEATSDGFWDWDIPGEKGQVNRRWAEMHGLSANDLELRMSDCFNLIHPEDRARVQETMQRTLAERGVRFEAEYRPACESGASKWLLARGSVVRWDAEGRALRATGTLTDITERKQAAERIRDSEERYRSVVAAMAEGIVVQDRHGNIKACNAAARQILGMRESELTGLTSADPVWNAIHADGSPFPGFDHPSMVTLRTGRPSLGVIVGLQRSDGSVQWISTNCEPLFHDGESTPYGVVSSFTDITAQRRDLQELEKARAAAETAARAKSEFLACMSHEIRTPMNGILGMAELLLDTGLHGDQREYAECIRSSGDALTTIINDILDFSKLETAKIQLEQVPFKLRDAITGVTTLLQSNAAKKSIGLNVSFAPGLATRYIGDQGRIRQIVLNLAGNAVKFTDCGEVRIEVEPAGGGIAIRVADSGIGISPGYLPHLFTKFSQADSSTARKYGGTGLGLAITKNLIDLMGGTIEVASEMGRGSTFTVKLPLAAT